MSGILFRTSRPAVIRFQPRKASVQSQRSIRARLRIALSASAYPPTPSERRAAARRKRALASIVLAVVMGVIALDALLGFLDWWSR